MLRRISLFLSLLCLAQGAFAQSRQRIDAPMPQESSSRSLPAWMTLPSSASPVSAVVIAHGSGGLDGRSVPYVNALNAAGIATFEIEMFKPNQRPVDISENIPHAMAALDYLAANPGIDPKRIGIMGMSWGGQLSLWMAGEKSYPPSAARRYAATLGLYPVCWRFIDGRAAREGILASPTGRPMLILAATDDSYDGPDDCQKLVDRVNALSPGTASLHMYRGATHQWDSARGAMSFTDAGAHRGRGGNVKVWPQHSVTADAAARTVAFFAAALAR